MGYAVLAAIIAELASIAIVSDLVGWLWTMAALAGGVVLGMSVLGRAGPVAFASLSGRSPASPARSPSGPGPLRGQLAVVDGALIALAGVLFMVPGFVTDVVGLALLLPPVRALARSRAKRWAEARVVVMPGASQARDGFIDVEGHETREPGSRPLELP